MLGEAAYGLNADTLTHCHIYPLFTVKSLPVSSAEYLHFFLTAELQDSELYQPLLHVMQLFLDALWRDLSAQTPCGERVQWGPNDEVVLPLGLGYVFPPTEFWATLTSVCIFLKFLESKSFLRTPTLIFKSLPNRHCYQLYRMCLGSHRSRSNKYCLGTALV